MLLSVRSKSLQSLAKPGSRNARATETPAPAFGMESRSPPNVAHLDYDHRIRRRIALTGAGGLSFLLDLTNAPVLSAGDASSWRTAVS